MKRFFNFFRTKWRSLKLVVKISFRNLVRHFRRNLFVGIGIIVCMIILMVTTSWTGGISDILFNKMIVYMYGHMRVDAKEFTTQRIDIIRDMPRIKQVIMENVDGIKEIDEAVSTFGRTFGNGKSGLLMVVGLNEDAEFYSDEDLAAGSVSALFEDDVFPGVVMYESAVEEINLKLNDTVMIKFSTIYGQAQAFKFKIVGLIPSQNMYMDMAGFTDMKVLRELLNMRPEETIGLNIVTDFPDQPDRVISSANKLHDALQPEVAGFTGDLRAGKKSVAADVFAFEINTNEDAAAVIKEKINFVQGSLDDLKSDNKGILLTQALAEKLGAKIGTRISYTYQPKYDDETVSDDVVVKGIIKQVEGFSEFSAFAHENVFYKTFFWNIPKNPPVIDREHALFSVLLPEWELLDRSPDTKSAMKKDSRLNREIWYGQRVDVETMYENASDVIMMQVVLNIIFIVVVAIMFVVILIGVVNTMRMSIKERTREIGTNRAIGMQRKDIRNVFVMEVVLLALFACIVGVVHSFGVMALFSSITFPVKDNPFSMFLVDQHLYFLPTVNIVIFNTVVILLIAWGISLFTARRVSKMRVADALRYFE